MTFDHLEKMVQDHNLNPLWFLTGIGNMFVDYDRLAKGWHSTPNSRHLIPDSVHLIKDARTINRVDISEFNNLSVEVSADDYSDYVEEPVEEYEKASGHWAKIPGVTGETRAIEVVRPNMRPVIETGDWVVCQAVPAGGQLTPGKVYAVIGSEIGIYVGYLTRSADGYIVNHANHVEYSPFVIPLKDVREIWEVEAVITRHFLSRSGLAVDNRLAQIEAFLSQRFPKWNAGAAKKEEE